MKSQYVVIYLLCLFEYVIDQGKYMNSTLIMICFYAMEPNFTIDKSCNIIYAGDY